MPTVEPQYKSEEQQHQQPNIAPVQPQLEIGEPNDQYEQEADSVADMVMQSGPEVQLMASGEDDDSIQMMGNEAHYDVPVMESFSSPEIQTMESEEEESVQMMPEIQKAAVAGGSSGDGEDNSIQLKKDSPPTIQCSANNPDIQLACNCPACTGSGTIQTKPQIQRSGNGSAQASPELSQQIQSSNGKGQALPKDTQQELGSKIGADFSNVNIHTDSNAVQMNKDLGAKAFTNGNDVYFNEGNYNPKSSEGKYLLAHELTHTIQQSGGDVKRKIQRDGDPIEQLSKGNPEPSYLLHMLTSGIWHEWPHVQLFAAKKVLEAYWAGEFDLDADEVELLGTVMFTGGNWDVVAHIKRNEYKKRVDETRPLGPVVEPKSGYYNEVDEDYNYQDKKPNRDPSTATKSDEYDESKVRAAGEKILKSDPKIMNAMIFLAKIKTTDPNGGWAAWEKELNEFITDGGSRRPIVEITDIPFTGLTPKGNKKMKEPHQEIKLSKHNDFSVAVATYLHELNHYIDTWYSSKAAKKDKTVNKRDQSERFYGIDQVDDDTEYKFDQNSTFGKQTVKLTDPTKEDQRNAMPEYFNALLEQILIDLKMPEPQPNEHWTIEDDNFKFRENYKKLGDTPTQNQLDEFFNGVTGDKTQPGVIAMVLGAMAGTYFEWGLQIDLNDPGKLKLSETDQYGVPDLGVEQGFAFEKAAFGFVNLAAHQGVSEDKWGGNFQSNFEKKFWMYLK
jgi:hypothetical protein